MTGAGSRIVGQGRLLRSLRLLLRRVDRYAAHRARTAVEITWAAELADSLQHAYTAALTPAARASLALADRRASISAKGGRGAQSSSRDTSQTAQPEDFVRYGLGTLGRGGRGVNP
jgi:hypothetical protein